MEDWLRWTFKVSFSLSSSSSFCLSPFFYLCLSLSLSLSVSLFLSFFLLYLKINSVILNNIIFTHSLGHLHIRMCWHLKYNIIVLSNTAFLHDVIVTAGCQHIRKVTQRCSIVPRGEFGLCEKLIDAQAGRSFIRALKVGSPLLQKDPFSSVFQGIVISASSLPSSERRRPCCSLVLTHLSQYISWVWECSVWKKKCLLNYFILLSLLLLFFSLGIWVTF